MFRLSSTSIANILTLALLIAIVFGSVMLFISRPAPTKITVLPPLPSATPAPSPTPESIQVYVTGAVAEPDSLLTLPFASRVQAAIEAAGGFTDSADKSSLNLAAFLRDGDHVHVAVLGEAITIATPSGGQKLRINLASLDALQTLPGVGPALAQRILDFREQRGDFRRLADLDAVPGIGAATLSRWRDLIAFD